MAFNETGSSFYAQKVENIRGEPASFQQLIIGMLNRLDLQFPTTMKENYRDWVAVETKLIILDAIMAPHFDEEYQMKRKVIKKMFNELRTSGNNWDSTKFLNIVSIWLFEMSSRFDSIDLMPPKHTTMDYEEIGEDQLSKEFLDKEALPRKEEKEMEEKHEQERKLEIEKETIRKTNIKIKS